ncbi:unnamed protein product [Lepidochelys kempii]
MCPGEISSGKAHVADRPGKPLGVLFWRRRGGRERMVRGGSEEVGGYRLLHTKEKSKEPITGSSLVIKGRARRLEGAGRKQLPELSLGRNPPPNTPPHASWPEGRTDAAGEASLCSAFPRGAVPGHRVSPALSVSLVLRTSRPQRANLLTRGKAAQLVAWLHPSRGLCWSLAEPDITRGQT